ncbi:MAG TPA: hypothetical protein VJ553_04325 [Candidatus Paceibacterota bacterium]|nr:hypothetical protein [Candidatus Paceibacterota bacterium]
MPRLLKQVAYGIVFAALIGLVLWPVYRLFVPSPSCTDGIQNQEEEGVDCGVICGVTCPPALVPLTVEPVRIILNDNGSWDVIVQLENENAVYGAPEVPYVLTVSDGDGATLVTRRGDAYVNPLQTTYLVFPLIKIEGAPVSATFAVDPAEVQWLAGTATDTTFAVRSDALTPSDERTRYEAIVINRTRFDFDLVDIVVLLEDSAGSVIGAGSTSVRTLRAGEERGFVVDWPFAVPGAARARAYVTTNLFSNDNYLREYGTQGRVPGF